MCLNVRMPWSKKPQICEKAEKPPRVVLHAPTEQLTTAPVPTQQKSMPTTQTQPSTKRIDLPKPTTTQPAKKKQPARSAGCSDAKEERRRQAAAGSNLTDPNNPTNIVVYSTIMDPVDPPGGCKKDGDDTKADHDRKVESTVDTTPKTEAFSTNSWVNYSSPNPPIIISAPSYSHTSHSNTSHSNTSHSYGGYESHSSGGYSGGGSSSNCGSGGGSSSNDYSGSSSNDYGGSSSNDY